MQAPHGVRWTLAAALFGLIGGCRTFPALESSEAGDAGADAVSPEPDLGANPPDGVANPDERDACEETCEPIDPCLHRGPGCTVVWVDPGLATQGSRDGSRARPFAAVADAVRAAAPNSVIWLATAVYSESVTVAVPGIVIEGNAATVAAPDGDAGVTVVADHVTLSNLTVTGGGVRAEATETGALAGLTLRDVTVTGVESADPAELAVGIELVRVQAAKLERCHVDGVHGADGALGAGGHATGIRIFQSHATTLVDCTVRSVAGGAAGVQLNAGESAFGGGIAKGVEVVSSLAGVITRLEAREIVGGAGGDAPVAGGTSALGGASGGAFGVELREANQPPWDQQWTLRACTIADLDAGQPGLSHGLDDRYAPFGRYGVRMDFGSVDADIDQSNVVDGQPIIHINKATGVTVSGLTLGGPDRAIPTNFGYVLVRLSTDVTLKDLQLSGDAPHPTLNAGDKALVTIASSQRVAIESVGFSDVRWGRALQISGSSQVLVRDVTVRGVDIGSYDEVVAVRVTDSSDSTIDGLAVTGVRTAARYSAPALLGLDGTCTDLTLRHLTLGGLELLGDASFLPAALRIGGPCTRCEIDHLTAVSVPGPGVHVEVAGATPVGVTSAVFAGLDDAGLRASESAATLDWALVEGEVTAGGAPAAHVMAGAPTFRNAGEHDYRLASGSAGIDLGDPAEACADEPAPNGCRVNLGAEGGTAEAASAPGATSCTVCPP